MKRRAGAALAAVALAGLVNCSVPIEVPPELLGTWTTEAEGFEGRAMIFSLASVTFETGEEPANSHAIVDVEMEAGSAGERRIECVYTGEAGKEYRLALLYRAESDTLRLVHRDSIIWRKSAAP